MKKLQIKEEELKTLKKRGASWNEIEEIYRKQDDGSTNSETKMETTYEILMKRTNEEIRQRREKASMDLKNDKERKTTIDSEELRNEIDEILEEFPEDLCKL